MNKNDQITMQLQLFKNWLSKAEDTATARCDIALSREDVHDFSKQHARMTAYRETLDVFALIMKNVDEILKRDDGGDDDEHDAIDPYYM